MTKGINRRDFLRTSATATAALAAARPSFGAAPAVRVSQGMTPVVISDYSGIGFKNGGPVNAVEQAFDLIRMLDAEGYPKAFIKVGGLKVEFHGVSKKGDKLSGRFEVKDEE